MKNEEIEKGSGRIGKGDEKEVRKREGRGAKKKTGRQRKKKIKQSNENNAGFRAWPIFHEVPLCRRQTAEMLAPKVDGGSNHDSNLQQMV